MIWEMLEKIWEKTEFFTKFKDDNFLIESRTKDPLHTIGTMIAGFQQQEKL